MYSDISGSRKYPVILNPFSGPSVNLAAVVRGGTTNSAVHRLMRYANDVHLSAVFENTALVEGIRCEPLDEHLIPLTCAVFFHTARK